MSGLIYGAEGSIKNDPALEQGKKIFKNCSGCHLNGQNLIKENKPIIGSSKIKSKDVFKEFLSEPHPPMPNFKKIADDPGKIDALLQYVKSLGQAPQRD